MTRRLYVDTSVAVKFFMDEQDSDTWVDAVTDEWNRGTLLISSHLLLLEARRVSYRAFGEHRFADPFVDRVDLVMLTPETLESASLIPHHVRSLDAIHLATAMQIRELTGSDLAFATADRGLARVAAQLGLDTLEAD